MNMRIRCGWWMLGLALLVGCGGGGSGGDDAGSEGFVPRAPEGVQAEGFDSHNVISWQSEADVSYRVYFSNEEGADKGSRTVIEGASSPYRHEGLTNGEAVFYVVTASNDEGEGPASTEVSATPISGGGGGGSADPLFAEQWHLENTGQGGAQAGEDAGVIGAWDLGPRGQDVLISVVDDGLEIAHEDLAPNVASGSYNYLDGSDDPTGGEHGTCCAGVAAARDLNGKGGRGAAPRANLIGFNLLQQLNTANEEDAMTRKVEEIAISSNSWGPPDNTGHLMPSSQEWRNGIVFGLENGRSGLGTIYTWAAGNGGSTPNGDPLDNSNYDGYANFFGVVAVGAVGDDGIRASYSEPGANLWVCAPSQGDNDHAITTVDRSGSDGYNNGQSGTDYTDPNYTNTFNGTSSATPLVSGVVALMLEANPTLTWRDVKLILAESARQNHPNHPDWVRNDGGHLVNHDYGFGVVDAEAAVQLALSWQNVPEMKSFLSDPSQPGLPIPDGDPDGVQDQIRIQNSDIERIEFIQIAFSANDHPWSADLDVILVSPSGNTVSFLAETHATQGQPPAYDSWVFGCARHLDEPADGDWTLVVRDRAPQDSGTFQAWQILFHGR